MIILDGRASKILISFGYGFLLSMMILVWSCANPVIAEELTLNQETIERGGSGNLQYAANMRYPRPQISYKIDDCPEKKVDDIKEAFNILSNETVLNFNEAYGEEELTISCQPDIYADAQEDGGGRVHLGTGGPQFHAGEKFSVIIHGEVDLKRNFDCKYPVVELHEILHALGFIHSSDPESIMYADADCVQRIGEELAREIDRLYLEPSLPDLSIESASLKRDGYDRSVLTFKINNLGLVKSKDITLAVYDVNKEKKIEEYNIEGIDINEHRGGRITFPFTASVLRLEIVSDFDELEKENNIMRVIRK